MAMSSSELIRRRQEEAQLYLARRKPRDASEITMMNQAKNSGFVFERGPGVAVSHTESFGAAKKGIGEPLIADDCSRTFVTTGNQTNAGSLGLLQAAQKCAVCSDPDPAFYPGIALTVNRYDRSVAPFAQRPVDAQQPACKVCNTFFFPAAGQPSACKCTDTPESLISMRFKTQH
jgi:hypothetical protein